MNAAYLWAQLLHADEINENRKATWNRYYEAFAPLAKKGLFDIPTVPVGCEHNAHMFYLKCRDLEQRQEFIKFMKDRQLYCVFHYIPLHSAPAGYRFGRFNSTDTYTTKESERLVRLPMYFGLTEDDGDKVIEGVKAFFESGKE